MPRAKLGGQCAGGGAGAPGSRRRCLVASQQAPRARCPSSWPCRAAAARRQSHARAGSCKQPSGCRLHRDQACLRAAAESADLLVCLVGRGWLELRAPGCSQKGRSGEARGGWWARVFVLSVCCAVARGAPILLWPTSRAHAAHGNTRTSDRCCSAQCTDPHPIVIAPGSPSPRLACPSSRPVCPPAAHSPGHGAAAFLG